MHKVVQPKALYFGTPVVLVSSVNEDGATNLAPMSSAWWVGARACSGWTPRPFPIRFPASLSTTTRYRSRVPWWIGLRTILVAPTVRFMRDSACGFRRAPLPRTLVNTGT